MSPSRKRFLIVLIVFLLVAFTGSFVYLKTLTDQSTVITFEVGSDTPEQTIELKRRGEDWFLVDTEHTYRTHRSRTYLNPVVLTRKKLKSYAREQWKVNNEWLAFQHLYVEYYTPFYRKRFDQELTISSEEIQLAYEFWQQQQTP